MKKYLIILALAISISINSQSKIDFMEYNLPNGLHVILHKDSKIPMIVTGVLYHVGSHNEKEGKTGYAHFFEHLMFEQTDNIPTDEFAKIVKAKGGQLNAHTSSDETYYFLKMPSNQLELAIWMEAERMNNAKITKEGVENQKEVVKEEKRQRSNQPYSSFIEETFKRIYKKSFYEWTPIGSFEDLNSAKISDFQEFYDQYYAPNNATIAIAGDIDIETTKEFIAKYFGHIKPSKNEIIRAEFTENFFTKETIDTIYDNIQLPALFITYPTCSLTHKDAIAVELLNNVLFEGKSSRIHKKLVEDEQKAMMVNGFPYSKEKAGLSIIMTIPNQGIELEELNKIIDEEIEKVKNELITDKELEKLKNSIQMNFVDNNMKLDRISYNLARYNTFYGNANYINNEIKDYEAITKEDIKRVANKYFDKNKRLKLIYLPKK